MNNLHKIAQEELSEIAYASIWEHITNILTRGKIKIIVDGDSVTFEPGGTCTAGWIHIDVWKNFGRPKIDFSGYVTEIRDGKVTYTLLKES